MQRFGGKNLVLWAQSSKVLRTLIPTSKTHKLMLNLKHVNSLMDLQGTTHMLKVTYVLQCFAK